MSNQDSDQPRFQDLGLPSTLLKGLDAVGYETPSPIQLQTIPLLLDGADLIGHAPTGTGKTAAFALPLLTRLSLKDQSVQVLVLVPTRELAIQVAEAFQRYAKFLSGFHVLPIYGGQDYGGQLRGLKRGLHVVVGTPGRVMDHIRRGTLKLGTLRTLVLDEADEMLRMGFIDDVEWILDQAPADRQIALFSATMPKEIQKIARKYLNNPQDISIKGRTATSETVRQRYWTVSNQHKLEALTRILEIETFDAILIFVRTKLATVEIADRLQARGFSAKAINGDMLQKNREQMIGQLKNGSIDILVATDVAARGLDVDRISHVVNYDIPYDTEAYIHRIGRTGRAGRSGDAIMFVTHREKRMLAAIEKATRQKIEQLQVPTTEMVNNKRIANFKQSISDKLAEGDLDFMQGILSQYQQEHDVPSLEIAAALAQLAIGDQPLLLDKALNTDLSRDSKPGRRKDGSDSRKEEKTGRSSKRKRSSREDPPEGMERFRIEVGHAHEVEPRNIVGAIANEAGLDAEHIGHIKIFDKFSLIDLPMGMPKDVFKDLKKTWVSGRQLGITRMADTSEDHKTKTQRTSKKMTDKKKTDRKTKKKKGRARKPADSDKA
jgi:ATP-dependent RNA helicase DeaD